ncbi:RDD family protein [Haloarchaeobius salinus]|uniref:RDD family protein n=1 Tax=Haloarchaeobius salinus TaxID=1198298 RepID=UPI00210BA2A9|nr:RDD family protein [Haloarchaeobius salinus]
MEIAAKADDAIPNRVMAFGVDWVILSLLSAVIWFLFWMVRAVLAIGGAASDGSVGTGLGVLAILLALVQWALIGVALLAYFTLLQTRSGQTLGMNLLDVKVVAADGSPVTRKQALVRNAVLIAPLPLMAVVSVFVPVIGFPLAFAMMVGWLLVELGAMFVLGDGQRIGDRLADTFVVEEADLVTEEVTGTPNEATQPGDA